MLGTNCYVGKNVNNELTVSCFIVSSLNVSYPMFLAKMFKRKLPKRARGWAKTKTKYFFRLVILPFWDSKPRQKGSTHPATQAYWVNRYPLMKNTIKIPLLTKC